MAVSVDLIPIYSVELGFPFLEDFIRRQQEQQEAPAPWRENRRGRSASSSSSHAAQAATDSLYEALDAQLDAASRS